jgi:MSHA pilin protein MshC
MTLLTSACMSSQRLSRPLRRRGFTLVELIVAIILVGLLAAVAAPRFLSKSAFESRGFFDQAQATVRYAQKLAVAQRRSIFVCVSASVISVSATSGCPTTLLDPSGTGAQLKATAPAGVSLSGTAGVNFDGLGKPNAGATITITSTVPNDPARRVVIEAETGYVHP